MDAPSDNHGFTEHSTVYRDDLLDGKVMLVSGGGSGIGYATACLAARLGAQVVVCGRTEEKLVTAVDSIKQQGDKADYLVTDIRERNLVDQTLDAVYTRYGRLDFLINSAGGQFPQAAMDFSERGWQAVIGTNLNGTWNMMQSAARRWAAARASGSIVNIVVVQQALHGVAHTRAARAGVVALSEALAVEWAPLGIRINCIAPGTIRTEGWAVYSESARAKYPRTNPTMRAGTPSEIAEACIYLSATSGAFITGEVLTVDGGGQHWGEIWTGGKPEYYAQATRLWDDEALD